MNEVIFIILLAILFIYLLGSFVFDFMNNFDDNNVTVKSWGKWENDRE